ncbi:MAG: hypothetical protein E6044_05225 [Actinomyces sp.]|nr:hypothetical protein [Actinomyces sp.]
MSDLTNPYGVGGASQGGYGQQDAYGAQSAYGSQASYGGQPPYGAGQPPYGGGPGMPGYGQSVYGSFAYSLNPAVERVRSNASMVRIMAFISFATLGPILSIGAWVWGGMLMSEAQGLNVPMDVMNDVSGARKIAMICSIVEIVGLVLLIILVVVLPNLLLFIAGDSGY